MKIALINASPRLQMKKHEHTVTSLLLEDVRRLIRKGSQHEFVEFHIKTAYPGEDMIRSILSCDVLVIGFPVYLSGLPAHMLSAMVAIEEASVWQAKEIMVYAIGHSALYEAAEVFPSLHMLEAWCERCSFNWGGGMAVGAGISHDQKNNVSDLALGRRRTYLRRLTGLTEAISDGVPILNAGCTTDASRNSFLRRYNRMVRKRAREMGVVPADIKEES
ncbi:MAG: NAD(P)H-dependent oxidoreductase [Lachnospiraceae bacterium]|nr:NAD(P)H-dependent oxidoreductase [Lachnospiraceae bacterium]